MKKTFRILSSYRIMVIVLATIVFIPALFNFFTADDWFHLRLTQISSFSEFLNYFSFIPNAQSAAFYRPIPTQVFFFIFHSLFGLNQLPYYFFVLISFAFSLFLVYQLSFLLTKSKNKALITTFIYGFSVTNFTRIYFLSAFQEISLVIFSFLTLIKYIEKKYSWSLVFFVLSLMSKETAIVLPFLMFALNFVQKEKIRLLRFLPYFLILAGYLYMRLKIFGLAEGNTYVWNFSPTTTINTFMWYILWAFGAPELFVDYIAGGFSVIPRFFTDYPFYAYFILIGLLWILFLFTLNFVLFVKKINHLFLFAGFFFLFSLLPVIFLPQHKFALELGLPLFGFALAVSLILNQKFLSYCFLLVFICYNLAMNQLTYTRHYSTRRAVLAERVYDYFLANHYPCPQNTFIFYNSGKTDYAKEIELTIGGSNMFKVVCNDPNTETRFSQPINSNFINIPSDIFFPI